MFSINDGVFIRTKHTHFPTVSQSFYE